jgi:hypothetical protein
MNLNCDKRMGLNDSGLGLRFRSCREKLVTSLCRNWFVIAVFSASVGYLVYGAVDAHDFYAALGR